MFSHTDIWNAIEEFAKHNNMTCSGLAKSCGLDATTFNKSKRFTKFGQPRWPTTQSLAKILQATNSDIMDFVQYLPKRQRN